MGDSVDIFGVRVDPVDESEATARAIEMALAKRASYIVTPNAEIVMAGRSDGELRDALNNSDLAIGDGVGLVWASRVLGRPLPERVSGIDLTMSLLREARQRELRVFLLGSTQEVVSAAARRIGSSLEVHVAGYHHGFLSADEERNVLDMILDARPHIILVGMGSPRQELWMARHASLIHRGVMIAVGGSLDVIAGAKQRAPVRMQKLGLEWLYRLITEPWRFRRMMALPRFAALVLLAKVHLIRE